MPLTIEQIKANIGKKWKDKELKEKKLSAKAKHNAIIRKMEEGEAPRLKVSTFKREI